MSASFQISLIEPIFDCFSFSRYFWQRLLEPFLLHLSANIFCGAFPGVKVIKSTFSVEFLSWRVANPTATKELMSINKVVNFKFVMIDLRVFNSFY